MKFHDAEFNPEFLRFLKKRDVLGRDNLAQFAPLWYNVCTAVENLEKKFQSERRSNPLLETSRPEAWIIAEIMPAIQQARSNADIDERLLSRALQEHLRNHTVRETLDGQELCKTIGSYLPTIENLLVDVCDREKSLRDILGLPVDAYTIREAFSPRKPGTQREAILVQGLSENWRPSRIAKALDDKGVKPNNKDYKSYRDMLRNNPQLFYSLKADVRKKYALPKKTST